jgi:hypothetical protein
MAWQKSIIMLTIIMNLFLIFAAQYSGSLGAISQITDTTIGVFVKLDSSNYSKIGMGAKNTTINAFPTQIQNPNQIAGTGSTFIMVDIIERIFTGILLIFSIVFGIYYLWFFIPLGAAQSQIILLVAVPMMIAYTLALYSWFRGGEM